MSPELATSIALILSFACFVTAHYSLAFRLILHSRPRWRGWLTLVPVVAWLAPYWGYRAGMQRAAWLWVGCFGAYMVSLVLAFIVGH